MFNDQPPTPHPGKSSRSKFLGNTSSVINFCARKFKNTRFVLALSGLPQPCILDLLASMHFNWGTRRHHAQLQMQTTQVCKRRVATNSKAQAALGNASSSSVTNTMGWVGCITSNTRNGTPPAPHPARRERWYPECKRCRHGEQDREMCDVCLIIHSIN